MGKFYDEIPETIIPFIEEQHMFWVASAPLSAHGHVNVSPKGYKGTFKLLGKNKCMYQDLSGSGLCGRSHPQIRRAASILHLAYRERNGFSSIREWENDHYVHCFPGPA